MDGRLKGREGRDRLIRRLGYLRFFFCVWDRKRGRGRKIRRNKEGKRRFRRWFSAKDWREGRDEERERRHES